MKPLFIVIPNETSHSLVMVWHSLKMLAWTKVSKKKKQKEKQLAFAIIEMRDPFHNFSSKILFYEWALAEIGMRAIFIEQR